MILVNAVETSSQPSTTDSQQVLSQQVVLALDKTTAITTSHLQNTIKALERLLKDQKTVEERICERSIWQVVQTFVRSPLAAPYEHRS
ncbi:hypothetical protein PI95_010770 [Hassallia byssoidea VB512170]|uniref:Uncharacterized protein n=2 Tax=Hassallia TaxID=482629 RepID=A0A846H7V8_9CYAN|nr:hypothetical protein [Hassalia byssoidea VB512170]